MTIAERIKIISDRNGITIRELAIKADIPEQSLRSMLKRDDYKFSSLLKIAKALSTSLESLINPEDITERNNVTYYFVREDETLTYEGISAFSTNSLSNLPIIGDQIFVLNEESASRVTDRVIRMDTLNDQDGILVTIFLD